MALGALTPFVAGETMVWSTFDTNFQTIRTFLNAGTALADVADASIAKEHLRRPAILPFPVTGFVSGFQSLYEYEYGSSTPFKIETEWGPVPDRVMIKPDQCDMGANRKWRTVIGKTVWAPGGTIRAYLTANMLVRVDNDATEYPSLTPAGTGTQENGGYLELYSYSRLTRAESAHTHSRRHIYPLQAAFDDNQPPVDNLNMMAHIPTDVGRYDVYLVYVRDTFADDHFLQIDLTTINFHIEAI
jgi:hypothetical protein